MLPISQLNMMLLSLLCDVTVLLWESTCFVLSMVNKYIIRWLIHASCVSFTYRNEVAHLLYQEAFCCCKIFDRICGALIGTLRKGYVCVHGSKARKMENSPVIIARQ